MVTSKQFSVDLFYQVSLPKSSKDFLQCMIKRRSLLSMVVCSFLGLAEAERKSRFYNHKLSFKHKRFSNKTTFSSYMLRLKSVSSEKPNLKWSVLNCVPPYSNISKKCLLCWYETGNSYLSKPEGTLEQEMWTPLYMLLSQQVPFKELHR